MSYDLPAMTLRHVLELTAKTYPDAPALSWVDGEPLTYQEFRESAEAIVLLLAEQGIGFGDSVVILAENCPHWGIAYFAITSMGAVAVPILTDFHPEAIRYIIRHSDAKAVFVTEKMFPKIEDAVFDPAPIFINLETFQVMEQGITRDRLRELKTASLREYRKFKGQTLRLAQMAPREPGEDDVAVIIYTSGTMGYSKGVVLTHKNIVYDAVHVRDFFTLGPNDRLLSLLPLPHTYECTLGLVLPVLNGSHIHYLDRPPTARALLPALEKVRPTAILTVPLIIEKIFRNSILPKLTSSKLRHTLYRFPAIRKILHRMAGKRLYALFGGELRIMAIGGAPLAPVVERFLREGKFPYVVGYGLTECAPLCSGAEVDTTRFMSSGFSIDGVSMRIDAPDENGEGELLVRGPNVMREYYKSPQDTAEVFTEDGWLRTGDLARLDEDGYVFIKGRRKNLILGPSGENIYPEEVEAIINQMEYVAESLVIQNEGKLVARIHLDSEQLDILHAGLSDEERRKKGLELLEKIKNDTNAKVSSFIRIHKTVLQPEPFEKTPTQKIKRYLYLGI
ncbi:AMP-dependent synthetase and ligase [uncultured delta proteobacterium]|uniref:AMP-dependent synthetase and ligase n=1 Tax=uncultured delta proteobacterium TaxID=34034 RepID=A0A212KHG5_9DELT|nr:AMP-dependent synthetase and ligase [uncultured delta proteobacterium]